MGRGRCGGAIAGASYRALPTLKSPMTQRPSFAHLVKAGRWADLEEAWSERLLEDPDPIPALGVIDAAARKKEIPRCVPLIKLHAETLAEAGRAAEAAKLTGEAMLRGGSPGELGTSLFKFAEAAWGAEEFWPAYVEIADLRTNTPDMRASWRAFEKLLGLEIGRVVYHAKGWGLGQVEGVDHGGREARVRFVSGRTDRFPYQTAIEIFEFLAADDLRCLVVSDPAELARRLKNEPLEVLRWVVMRHAGKATQVGIKLAMATLGVEGPRFNAWWRKSKKAAEASEWFELSGPANKVQVRLLDIASDPVEGMRRQLARAKSLGEALTRVRALVAGGNADQEVVQAAIETVEELAGDEDQPLPQRFATWLFLREYRNETPELLREVLARAAAQVASDDPSQRPELWNLFHEVPTARDQERCIELLPEVLGDGWLDESALHLHHAAPGMVRGLVEHLESAQRTDELLEHYKAALARPTRNPMLFIRLAQRLEKGKWEDQLPPRLRRAQCLLQLAVHLDRFSVGDPVLTRARTRLTEALTKGERPLLRRLLEGSDVESLRGLASMIEAGVERDIERLFTRLAVEVSPVVFRGEDKPFWEVTGVWTTRAGLARREEELRLLREVKIPENSEAIGKAASYGDLSENSEWEAAIEDQRTLTQRAMDLETEIRDAHLLENAAIPPDTVAPGTAVVYRDESGERHRIEVVGPWDVEREGHVSYRSPLAKGMLGAHSGDSRTCELPSGRVVVEILAIDLLGV